MKICKSGENIVRTLVCPSPTIRWWPVLFRPLALTPASPTPCHVILEQILDLMLVHLKLFL